MSIDFETVSSGTGSWDGKTSVSEEKVKELALEQAGQKEEDVKFLKTEKEYEDGRLVYETELRTADYKNTSTNSTGQTEP